MSIWKRFWYLYWSNPNLHLKFQIQSTTNSVNSLPINSVTFTAKPPHFLLYLATFYFTELFLYHIFVIFFGISWHQPHRKFRYLRQLNLKFIALSDQANMSSIDTHKQFIIFLPCYFFRLLISTNFRIFFKLTSTSPLAAWLQCCRVRLGQTEVSLFTCETNICVWARTFSLQWLCANRNNNNNNNSNVGNALSLASIMNEWAKWRSFAAHQSVAIMPSTGMQPHSCKCNTVQLLLLFVLFCYPFVGAPLPPKRLKAHSKQFIICI